MKRFISFACNAISILSYAARHEHDKTGKSAFTRRIGDEGVLNLLSVTFKDIRSHLGSFRDSQRKKSKNCRQPKKKAWKRKLETVHKSFLNNLVNQLFTFINVRRAESKIS